MRVLMMGTGPFAVPTFRWLIASTHDVPALVTRPERGRRRRRKAPPNPMREVAEQHDLPVYAPESINSDEGHDLLQRLEAELFVVCDFGQILSRETLALAQRGGINLHGSLLPKYRGAAPVNWAIYSGEKETGVSVIHMTPWLDSGPIISVRRTPIGPDETAVELETRLAELGVDAVREAIERLAAAPPDEAIGHVQDPSQATKAPRLSKEDGAVDWTRSARQIKDQVRAFKPWPGTYSNLQRKGQSPVRLILDRVSIPEDIFASPDPKLDGPEPGDVVHVEKNRLLVATGDGLLSLDRVQPAGKRAMDIGQWLRGHDVSVGDRFVSDGHS